MPDKRRIYRGTEKWDRAEVERAIEDNNPQELLRAVIDVSMHEEDFSFAQEICIKLSAHDHFNVRGNAVLGFGHIARVHRQLNQAIVQPIIRAALYDQDDYVRGQADAAADDTTRFLGWHYD